MAAASAHQTLKRAPDFSFRRVGIFVQERFRRQYPAVQTIPALKSLLFDESFLDGMGILWRAQSVEGDDLFSGCERDRQATRTHRTFIQQHRACAALSQAATESGIVQSEVVSKDVQKGAFWIHIDNVCLAVHLE